jgi:hypothetical protein
MTLVITILADQLYLGGMKFPRLIILALGLFLFLLGTGCTGPGMVNSWTRPGLVNKPYKKILILGLINEPDRSVREKIETHLAGDLRALGYAALCACEEFQPNTFYGLTEAQMLAQMEENSFDAVMTVVLLSKEKERRPRSGQYSNNVPGYSRQLWSYYHQVYDMGYEADRYLETTSYVWETNLYDLEDHGQVYSAQTRSFDPESVNTMAHQFSLLIIKDMLRKNILADQSKTLKAF